jgi:hypothetical protein
VLQNTLKPATITPNGGVAGLGNQANAAITQYAGGGGLTIRRCQFLAFNLGVHYYGNYANIAQLVGELYIEEMKINGCCFGALVEQPNSWWMINSESQNTQNSLNAAGSDTTVDPGHLLYVTDRPGAVPILGTISNVQGTNDLAEVVKVRKGLSVNASGINVQGSNRGAAFYQLNGLVLTGYEATITQLDMTDTQISGLEITDCAQAVVIAPRINIVGAQAYGLRLRVDLAPTNAKNCRIVNPTVIGDWTLNTSSPFRIENYVDTVIEDPLFMHVGSNAGAGHWPVEVVSGTRVSVLRPRHYLVGGGTAPADAAFVVSFDSASTNCLVDINASALSPGVVYSGANTVHDSGVSSQLIGPYFGGFYGSNGAITAGSSLSGMSITAGGAVVIASSAVAMAKQKLSADGVIERWYGPAGTVIGNVTTSGTSLRLSLDQANTVFFSTGNGSPAGSVTAGVGSIYVNRGGTAGSILWVKQSATDATGWTAIA